MPTLKRLTLHRRLLRSAEYMERYEAIYAEQRALGKSPEAADFFGTSYADRREMKDSHEEATLYAARYSALREEGQSHKFAEVYIAALLESENEDYAFAYASMLDDGKSVEYATIFANDYVSHMNWKRAAAYADQRALGESHEWANAYAKIYGAISIEVINQWGSTDPDDVALATRYADIYMYFFSIRHYYTQDGFDGHKFAETYMPIYFSAMQDSGKSADYAHNYALLKAAGNKYRIRQLIGSWIRCPD